MLYFYICIVFSSDIAGELTRLERNLNFNGTIHRLKFYLLRASVILQLIIIKAHIIQEGIVCCIGGIRCICIGTLIQSLHVGIVVITCRSAGNRGYQKFCIIRNCFRICERGSYGNFIIFICINCIRCSVQISLQSLLS